MNVISGAVPLESTGERMIPERSDPVTFWEHVNRYRLAVTYVKGKDVLDIACGEGYGTAAILKAGARSVVGVDISTDAVEHAKRKYGVDAQVGAAEKIPMPSASRDLIVSFETIEHVASPAEFLEECLRVLRPGGRLIVSTPNLEIYKRRIADNPFHCSEMSPREFMALFKFGFESPDFYGQGWPEAWYMRRRWFRWMIKFSRQLFDLPHPADLSTQNKQNVVDLCSRHTGWFEKLVSIDSIRSPGQTSLEECMYIIAVAQKKIV